jgi:hypothetical protein
MSNDTLVEEIYETDTLAHRYRVDGLGGSRLRRDASQAHPYPTGADRPGGGIGIRQGVACAMG